MVEDGIAGSEEGGDGSLSLFGEDIAMRAGKFPDQTVGPEEAELPGDAARLASALSPSGHATRPNCSTGLDQHVQVIHAGLAATVGALD